MQVMELLLFKKNTSATIDFSIETLRKEILHVLGQKKWFISFDESLLIAHFEIRKSEHYSEDHNDWLPNWCLLHKYNLFDWGLDGRNQSFSFWKKKTLKNSMTLTSQSFFGKTTRNLRLAWKQKVFQSGPPSKVWSFWFGTWWKK